MGDHGDVGGTQQRIKRCNVLNGTGPTVELSSSPRKFPRPQSVPGKDTSRRLGALPTTWKILVLMRSANPDAANPRWARR